MSKLPAIFVPFSLSVFGRFGEKVLEGDVKLDLQMRRRFNTEKHIGMAAPGFCPSLTMLGLDTTGFDIDDPAFGNWNGCFNKVDTFTGLSCWKVFER